MRKQIVGTVIAAVLAATAATVAVVADAAHQARATGRSAAPASPAPGSPAPRAAGATAGPGFAALDAMTAALASTPHTVVMSTPSSSTTGTIDPAGHAATAVARTAGMEIDETVAGGAVYVKVDLGTQLDTQFGIKPGVWMSVDAGKLGASNELLVQPDGSDPVDMAGIEAGVTALHALDPQHLAGTLDLTKVSGHTVPNPQEVAQAGPPATRVPFRVSADAAGRISELTVDTSGFDPSLALDVRFGGYGTPAHIARPAGAVPAPPNVYQLFTG